MHCAKVISTAPYLCGFVRDFPRLSAKAQTGKLKRFGVEEIRIHDTLDGVMSVVSGRRRAVVVVVELHVLAPPKLLTNSNPRLDLWAAVKAIEAKGATITEVDSGRNSGNKDERDDMIAEAIEKITHAGRAPRRRDGAGRPPDEFTDEQIEFALHEWYNLRHKTNAAALAAIQKRIPNWTINRCQKWKAKGFGPSGRNN